MATHEEVIALVHRLVRRIDTIDTVDWTPFTTSQRREVFSLVIYETQRRARVGPNRKASALLRSWLTPEQQDQLRRTGRFYVRGSDGGLYRLWPHGCTERVKRHGKHWFAVMSYCFHDDKGDLPGPDLCLAHLLHLVTDEIDFLTRANGSARGLDMWDGAYRQRLREAREQRMRIDEVAEAAGIPPGAAA